MTDPDPDHSDQGVHARDLAATPDLPLILEQMQDQLDDLALAVEAQQRLINVLTSRIATLERHKS